MKWLLFTTIHATLIIMNSCKVYLILASSTIRSVNNSNYLANFSCWISRVKLSEPPLANSQNNPLNHLNEPHTNWWIRGALSQQTDYCKGKFLCLRVNRGTFYPSTMRWTELDQVHDRTGWLLTLRKDLVPCRKRASETESIWYYFYRGFSLQIPRGRNLNTLLVFTM